MKWLFIHRNFPGQYLHVIRHLADAGDEVIAITQSQQSQADGIRVISYEPTRPDTPMHRYVQELDLAVRNGLAVAAECEKLADEGFLPDVIVGHSGWGEISFVKDVWPSRPLLGYFEFFYRATGSDANFDPEFPSEPDLAKRLRVRNAINLIGLEAADWGQTPTRWQYEQYPKQLRNRISVMHEGVDTDFVRPEPSARLWLKGGLCLSASDQIITYSARSLEPYRGFHIFMRALPHILRELPNARILIVGGDGASYGDPPRNGSSWRELLLREVAGEIDLGRIHFLGRLNFRHYLTVLQISSVHAYLTYPFILSWGLLEAMSAGCLVIGSRTPPVEEVLIDGENGYLVDFFDSDELARQIVELARRGGSDSVRRAARKTIVDRYDLVSRCLPAQISLLRDLADGSAPA